MENRAVRASIVAAANGAPQMSTAARLTGG